MITLGEWLQKGTPKCFPNFWSLSYILNSPGATLKNSEDQEKKKKKEGSWSLTAWEGGAEVRRACGVRALFIRSQVRDLSRSFQRFLSQRGCSCYAQYLPQRALYSVISKLRWVCRENSRSFCLLCEIPSINWICGELAYRFFHFAGQQQRTATHTGTGTLFLASLSR